jgi:radical SAM-linked protein
VDLGSEPAKVAVPEPRQRWRLVVARAVDAPRLARRETADAWEGAVDASGLPVAWTAATPARPRLAFGAPLTMGMAAERELMDLVLTERLPRWRVREDLERVVPDGWSLVDLEDAWLGGPALGGIVAAADYRITLEVGPDGAEAVDEACRAVLAAATLPRQREKGGSLVAYDLRPLLADVAVVIDGPPVVIRTRTRFHPSLGTGRPEEVVAALADQLGWPLAASSIVRERLLLADELA